MRIGKVWLAVYAIGTYLQNHTQLEFAIKYFWCIISSQLLWESVYLDSVNRGFAWISVPSAIILLIWRNIQLLQASRLSKHATEQTYLDSGHSICCFGIFCEISSTIYDWTIGNATFNDMNLFTQYQIVLVVV